jgi:DMSO/TMAO reductase YedYZ molybdopterin-dependent catalytic subunit
MAPVTRGFHGRRRESAEDVGRVPPGQYVTSDFPVLSAGPTPHTPLGDWTFRVRQPSGTSTTWTWSQLMAQPSEDVTVDIHCVTRWSKLSTPWRAIRIDTLLPDITEDARFVRAVCDGGYTTNLPLADVTGGQGWLAFEYDGRPLAPEHGGPARLLVPHLYFWKSAKWIRGLDLLTADQPGFWERYGYHNYGDPWREQRYAGD